MKIVSFTPTTGVTLSNTQDQYEDAFADYLKSILEYWDKNNPGCKLSLSKETTDNSGKTAKINSTNCSNRLSSLFTTAINDKSITKSDVDVNTIKITWVKDSSSKPQEKKDEKQEKSEKKDKGTKKTETDNDSEASKEAMYDRVFGGIGQGYIKSALAGVQNAGKTVTGESLYMNDKRLIEEIDRIKELLK